jgi:hypothetical protein
MIGCVIFLSVARVPFDGHQIGQAFGALGVIFGIVGAVVGLVNSLRQSRSQGNTGLADGAGQSASEFATLDPKADRLLQQGVVAETDGNWEKAAKLYVKVTKRYPRTIAARDADARIHALRAQGKVA